MTRQLLIDTLLTGQSLTHQMKSSIALAETNIVPDSGPARHRRKDARPSELTAAALELFVEKGFAATRLDDVAARAGVSKGLLYLYFDSKEALFKAVIEEGIVPILESAERELAEYEGDSVDLLHRLLFGWWELFGGTRLSGVSKLILSESNNFPDVARYYHDRVIARGRALMRAVLQHGVNRGEFHVPDLEKSIDVILAPLMMLVIWRSAPHLYGRDTDPTTFLQTHYELLVHGLRVPKETR